MKKNTLPSFTNKKETYYHGDLVEASIGNTFLIGRLYVESATRAYLCQDITSGSTPRDGNIFGYRYSWVFTISVDYTDGVKIYKKLKNSEKVPEYYIKDTNKSLSITLLDNSFKFNIKKSEYPACCGASILHEYSISYIKLPKQEKIMEAINNFVKNSPMNNLIVVKGDIGHVFFTKYLGFVEDESWVNWNDRGADLVMLSHINIKEDYDPDDNIEDDEYYNDQL